MFRFVLLFFAVANGVFAYQFDASANWFICGMCTACAIDAFLREKSYE